MIDKVSGQERAAVSRTIPIPETVLLSAESLDDVYDLLAANDPAFLSEMRRIRADEDLQGHGKDLSELLERWPIG